MIWSVVEDITMRKNTETALLKAKAMAESAAQMKSMFLANMSHEIRTPLNGVIGMLDLLSRTGLTAHQQSHVDVAMRSGQSLMSIINDVLDFSKIEAGKVSLELVDFSLTDAVQDVVRLLNHLASTKNVVLNVQFGSLQQVKVCGDEIRFKQILSNLLSNALKFTHAGKVTIQLDSRVQANKVVCDVQVIDTGIGMTAEQQANLFTPFTQADVSTTRKFGGTGLGLVISRQLCNLMGGDISVSSQFGVGTRFSFSVVFSAALTGRLSTETPEFSEQHSLAGRCVLLVEDNEINTMVASMMLKEAGIQVKTAQTGREALRVLKAEQTIGANQIELVLMDCLMPEMDGFEATKAIRQGEAGDYWQRIPIIALTANAIVEEQKKCFDAGMDDFLRKPIQAKILLSKIAEYLCPNAAPTADADTAEETMPDLTDGAIVEAPAITWRLEDLQVQFGSMAGMIPQLIPVFLQQSENVAAELTQMLAEHQWRGIELKAHSLKGSSGQMMLVELKQAAAEVEQLAKRLNQQGSVASDEDLLLVTAAVQHFQRVLEASRDVLRAAL